MANSKKSIFKRISSVMLALLCSVSFLAASLDHSMFTAEAAVPDESHLATTEQIIAKASLLLGTPYNWGKKGGDAYGSGSTYTTAYTRSQGIDCSGLVWWTLAKLNYKTSGFVQNNPVPSDTYNWEAQSGKTPKVTRNGVTTNIIKEKDNLPTPASGASKTYKWWKKADGTDISAGSIVIAKTADGIDHAWIYIGKFNSVSEVKTYLKNAVQKYESSSYNSLLSLINSSTYVYDDGSGSKYWRIEATSGKGVVVNNSGDGKDSKALSITTYVPSQRLANFSITKRDAEHPENLVGKSKVDGSTAVYGIYTNQNCTAASKVGEITIGANGIGTKGLFYDSSLKYYAKEIKAPKGWELDTTVREIHPNAMLNVTEDVEYIGTIKINKQAEDGLSVANRKFRITYIENGTSKKVEKSTNSSGVVSFTKLPVYDTRGTGKAIKYTVSEVLTTAEQETIIKPVDQSVYLDKYANADYTVNLTFVNKKNTGNLKIQKDFYDANGVKLTSADLSDEDYSQVTFQLWTADNAPVKVSGSAGTYTYVSSGQTASNLKLKSKSDLTLTVSDLPVGEYIVKETSCSISYTADSDGEVVITRGKTATVKMSNAHISPTYKYARVTKDWKLYTDNYGDGSVLNAKELNTLNSQIFFLVAIKYEYNGKTLTKYLSNVVYDGVASTDGSYYSQFDANVVDSGTGDLIADNFANNYINASYLPISYSRSGFQINNLPESTIQVIVKEFVISDGFGKYTSEQIIDKIDECVHTADHKLSNGKYLSELYRADSGTMRDNNLGDIGSEKARNYINHFIADGNGSADDPNNWVYATFGNKTAASAKLINREKYLQLGFAKSNSETGNRVTGGEFMLYRKVGDDYIALLDEPIPAKDAVYTWFPNYYSPGYEYYVCEITAPDGFIPDTETYYLIDTCTTASDGSTNHVTTQITELPLRSVYISSIENAPMYGIIEINKTDNKYNLPLEGITFEVKNDEGIVVDTLTTDENGYAVSQQLDLGYYTVIETTETSPYVIDSTPINVLITSDDYVETLHYAVKTLDIKNEIETGILNVYKYGYDNLALEGAVFEVRYKASYTETDGTEHAANEVVCELTTDADGFATTEGYVLFVDAEYILVETEAPDGYITPSTGTEFSFEWDGNAIANKTIEITNSPKTGTITVQKHTEGDLNIEGIKFILTGTSDLGVEVYLEAVTDADGVATFSGVLVGTYIITEDGDSVPYAYLVADEQTVTVIYAQTSNVEFFNQEKEGTITVQKRTEGDLNREGIDFVLSGTSDSGRDIEITATTDADGVATFDNIPIGTYIITEDQDTTPYAYLTAEPQEVEVFYAQTSNVEFFNQEKEGTITVQKRTEGDLNREGIDFVLSGTSDSGRDIEITATTDADGVALFEGIPIGTYTITEDEESVPYAYLTAEPQEVEVFYAQTTDVTFYNNEQEGSITVQKRTEGDLNREGINFILSGTSGSGRDIEITATTDADGIAHFEGIPIGTYTITEVGDSVPYAYLTAEPQEVEVFYAQTTDVSFFNAEMEGEIQIQKRTEGMVNIEGITLILTGTSDSGREIELRAITDENGVAIFKKIPIGTYTVTEDGESVPVGYITAEPQKVEVFYAQTTNTEFRNDTTKIEFSKKSITGDDELPGAILQVIDKDGAIIEEWISTTEAHKIYGKLKAGETYTLHEEISPDGYVVANDIQFTVYENGEVQHVEMVDDTTKLEVSKVAITGGDELPGATLQVIDKDGAVIEEWVSTTEVHKIYGKLKAGETYTLHEEISPDGFVVANDIQFTVYEDGKVQHVEMVDDTTKIEVSKVAITGGDELPGATLQVIDKDGAVIEEWVSTTEVHKIYGKLKAGETYTLRETIAPDGYELATDILFTVYENGEVQHVEMVDRITTETYDNPGRGTTTDTGSEINHKPYVLFADTFALFIVAFYVIHKRRKANK